MQILGQSECNATISRQILEIIFQIMDSCPCERHIFMHMTHSSGGKQTVLEYLVAFVSSDDGAGVVGGDEDAKIMRSKLTTSALNCIQKIISSSIPCHSLSDFASSGCYGNPKMESMLMAQVLESVLRGLKYHPFAARKQSTSMWPDIARDRKVFAVFFCDDFDTFFVGKPAEAFRRMIRSDADVQKFWNVLNKK